MTGGQEAAPRRKSIRRRLLLAYLLLLAASHLTWALREPARELGAQDHLLELRAVGGGAGAEPVPLVYRDSAPGGDDSHAGGQRPVLLVIHGSPGSKHDFRRVEQELGTGFRVVAPDLPGFGESWGAAPDYSIAAHAAYLEGLIERLELSPVHAVGFSMGGGVALHLAERAPERVASLSLVASIGVQELEMFGDYQLNRLFHGLQLAALHGLRWGVPHFGAFDRFPLNVAYARNFYDTDQRPLRALLQELRQPVLVLHGERDFLVPKETALETHRLVPQSELVMLAEGHLLPWMAPEAMAEAIAGFVGEVEAGRGTSRAGASAERIEAAQQPFDPESARLRGIGLALAFLLIALATLVSEDLTCIGTGLMVAHGRIAFWPGTLACLLGIFFGDILLYLAGRFLGRGVARRAPLRWVLSPAKIRRASAWYRARGMRVVFLSRFIPGLRLPSYFAAGLLRTHFWTFTLYFFLAAAVWSPLLVGFASWIGEEARGLLRQFEHFALPAILLLALFILALQRLVVPAFSPTGRRLLAGRWKRLIEWEFWPPWIFYLPVAAYIAWLSLRHRSLSVMTAVNPAIPSGGFVGESKSAILDGLAAHEQLLVKYLVLRADDGAEERERQALEFVSGNGLSYPVVLKPDVGQRGSGVVMVRDEADLSRRARAGQVDLLLQEFAPGEEFGIFYYRMPGEDCGQIFSVTEKRFPAVTGDGVHDLEALILRDKRAVAMASIYFDRLSERLQEVPAKGEVVPLVEVGTHCLGAEFRDGAWLTTPELERVMDEISHSYEGFYFGRYDLRAPDVTELQAGRGFRILELNGLTSEATSIYDASNSLRAAYRVLFEQWRIAFEIGRRNRAAGAPVTGMGELFREWRRYRKLQAAHPEA